MIMKWLEPYYTSSIKASILKHPEESIVEDLHPWDGQTFLKVLKS